MSCDGATGSAGATRSELRDFYDDYFACLEDQDLSRWPRFFTEKARYVVQSRENFALGLPIGDIFCDGAAMIRDRATALANTSVFEARQLRHFAGTLRLRKPASAGLIRAELAYLAVESIVGEATQLFSAGRSFDEIVRDGDRFRFARRIVVYDHGFIRNSLIFPL
jgi:anthranilate 1,2-dioxygenase small subunit